MLWAISGGRCQYRGCNKILYSDILTMKNFNQSYIAHIVADSPNGPRGCNERSNLLANEISNLMLLCDTHHRLIDIDDEEGHSEELLQEMKKEHENRIEIVTDISVNMSSHILIYKANVGKHTPPLSYDDLKYFLLPKFYPATNKSFDLSLTNSAQRDKDELFWQTETNNIETQFNEQIKPMLRKCEIKHLSIFAFAPTPLLIKLGTLINDIHAVEIHQPRRELNTWNLEDIDSDFELQLIKPKEKENQVALNISLSATINNERITRVLGEDCSIYTLTINEPFNDFLKSKGQLRKFSVEIRKIFDEIKAKFGEELTLNIFPAMPIATAIELGRIWMPKADMNLTIFDQNSSNGGFFEALKIENT